MVKLSHHFAMFADKSANTLANQNAEMMNSHCGVNTVIHKTNYIICIKKINIKIVIIYIKVCCIQAKWSNKVCDPTDTGVYITWEQKNYQNISFLFFRDILYTEYNS